MQRQASMLYQKLTREPIGRLFEFIKVNQLVRAERISLLVDKRRHAASDRDFFGMAFEIVQAPGESPRNHQIVGIKEGDEFSTGLFEACISGRGRA